MLLKKVVLFFFIAHFLTGGMLEKEMSKWDGYWRHYQYHVRRNPDYTFTRFIYVHFLDGKHTKWLKKRHRSVPFRKRDTQAAPVLICDKRPDSSFVFLPVEKILFIHIDAYRIPQLLFVLVKPPTL